MSPKAKGRLTLLLKICVAVGLITYLVQKGHLDPKDLWELMTPANIALALGLAGLSTLMAAWRWTILLQARGFPVTLRSCFSLYLIGIFFNHALPGSVGGDVVRGYYLVAENPDRRMDSVLSIVIDRVLGLYSFFMLTLAATALDFEFVSSHENIRWVALMCFLIFTGLTCFFVVAFSHRLSKLFGLDFFERRIPIVHRIVVGIHHFGRDRKVIALSVLVSLVTQLITCLFFYQMGLVSGESAITFNAVLFAVPMGFLVTAIPLAPAGIGVGQVAFSYLFQAYLEKETQFGANSITAYQLSAMCLAVLGAVIYLKRKKPKELE